MEMDNQNENNELENCIWAFLSGFAAIIWFYFL